MNGSDAVLDDVWTKLSWSAVSSVSVCVSYLVDLQVCTRCYSSSKGCGYGVSGAERVNKSVKNIDSATNRSCKISCVR